MLKIKFLLPLSLLLLLLISSCATKKAVTELSNNTQDTAFAEEQVEDNPRLWQEKFERGVDFVATGNEPFWSLEIDEEGVLKFKALHAETGSIKVPVPAAITTAEGAVYTAETSKGPLVVQLQRASCEDTMSGKKSSYTVTVRYPGQAFSGCGNYLSDSRLAGNWVLEELHGKAITAERKPLLNFSLTENRVSGNAGCNRITGSVEVKGDKLYFGAIAATRMACPDLKVESQVLQVLSKRELTYKIEDGRLRLLQDGEEVMVLQAGG
ncbi:META domain-containing protein [Pontibacter kalidii]|uniref:META domain-containing protein n=1 Tax=Pontibacter kalidii TaxID=2592049 RepID=UPI00225819D8|nr:META domain-containing protein [Pontibacter kalidii]